MGSALNSREVALVLQVRNEMRKGLVQAETELRAFAGTAKQTGAQAAASLGAVTSASGMLRGAIGALGVGVGTAQLVSFAIQSIATASEIHDMSVKLTVGTSALQTYKYAARQTGTDLGAVTTAIRFLGKNIDEAVTGNKAMAASFKSIGLDAQELAGMKLDDAFEAVMAATSGMPTANAQLRVMTDLFGRGGSEVRKFAAEFPALKSQAIAAGIVVKESTINTLDVMGDKVDDIKSRWEAFGMRALVVADEVARAAFASQGIYGSGGESTPKTYGKIVPWGGSALDFGQGMLAEQARLLGSVTNEAKRLGIAVSEWRFENGEAVLFPRDQADILKDINTELNKTAATVKAIAAVGPMGWGFDKGVENFGPDKFAMGDVGYQPAGKWYEGQDERTKANLQSMHEYVESLQEVNRLSEEALRLDREHADELRRMKTEAIDGIYTGMSSIFDLVNEGNSEWARGLQKIYGWYRAIEAISRAIGLMKMILGPAAGSGGSLVGTSPVPTGNPGIVAMDSWTGAPAPSLAGAASQGQTVVYAPVTVAPGSLLVADDSMSIARLGDKLARHIETKVNNTFRERLVS